MADADVRKRCEEIFKAQFGYTPGVVLHCTRRLLLLLESNSVRLQIMITYTIPTPPKDIPDIPELPDIPCYKYW